MDHLLAIYQDYASAISLTLGLMPWESIDAALQTLHEARIQQRTVFVIGCGTSGTAAAHLADELDTLTPTSASEFPPFRVTSLIDSVPVASSWGENRHCDSLTSWLIPRMRAGDVVIAISSHGTSFELVQALRRARANGGFTIGLGSEHDRHLADEVELPVLVPNDSLDQIEDAHQIIIHILIKALRRYHERDLFNWKNKWRVVANKKCKPRAVVRPLVYVAALRRQK